VSVGDILRSLLLGVDPPAAGRQTDRGRPKSESGDAKGGGGMRGDALVDRLRRLLGERRTILSGNIHLIGLSRIRTQLGDDWPRLSGRAHEVAEKAIQQHCGREDIHTRHDDLSYLVIFARLTPEQAQLRCHEISEEIGRKLLGENFAAAAAEVSTGVFEADGSLVLSAIDKQELIRRLLGEGAAPPAPEPAPEPAAAEPALPDFSFARMNKAKALASMKILYRPIWHLRHKAITAYFATAGADSLFGKRLWDDQLRAEYAGILDPSEFDIYVMQRALRDLASTVAEGRRILLGWPVHFETIAARVSRQAYLGLCRDVPDQIRQLLFLEIDGLPPGTPASRLVDITTTLKPFCRQIIVRVPPGYQGLAQLGGAGISLVGISASALPDGDTRRIRAITEFAAAAHKVALRPYVHGLSSRPQVLTAIAAGYEFVNGLAVEQARDLPGEVTRFNLDDLYRDVM